MYAGLGLGRSLDEPGRVVPVENGGIDGNITMRLRRGGVCADDTLAAVGGTSAVRAAVDRSFVTSVRGNGRDGNVTMRLRRGGVCADDTSAAAGGTSAVRAAVDRAFVTSVRGNGRD